MFKLAISGTSFLGTIGEIGDVFQAKLLRVLKEREVFSGGEDTPHKVDVRVLVATHRDLKALVASGEFREDLYYRIAGSPIELPPLCDRPANVVPRA